jgi:ligand-binding sensor domain-containing protein/signal transduction histidine kinase
MRLLRGRVGPAAAVALVVFAGQGFAIDPHRAMSQYVHDRWSAEQGLPRGPIYAISQTTDGYLWIGTEAGLIRFDGWNFRNIQDETGAITMSSVLGLTAENDNCLWVRMLDLTIVRYCRGKFESSPSLQQFANNISATASSNERNLLVAKMDEGIYEVNGFKLLAPARDLPRTPVTAMAQMRNGEVWIGTRDAGVFRLQPHGIAGIRDGLPDLKVNCLFAEGDGELWIGTDRGIVRWNGSELTSAGIPAALRDVQVLALTKDRDGNLWIGTDSRGLLRLNASGLSAHIEEEGSRKAITAIFEDREGNLWVGSANGLERLRDSTFVSYSNPEGLPTAEGSPVFVDPDLRVWFAPEGGGLGWFKDEQRGQVRADGIDKDVVYSIAGAGNQLWAGRQRGGLTSLRWENGSVFAKSYRQTDGLAQNSVYAVYQSRDGAVWAGALSGGVSRLAAGRFTNFSTVNGLASNMVTAILETSDGIMWFATPNGLSALSSGVWKIYGAAHGLPSENVNCLYEDTKGVFWAGTASGPAFRRASGFQVPAGLPASLREQILGLAEDRDGFLWVSTSNHVLRVNLDKLLRGELGDGDVRQFESADGLRGTEGVKRSESVRVDAIGRVWFSLTSGISMADPVRLRNASAPAIVHVQTISADGDAVDLLRGIKIAPGRRRIEFGFVGLNLASPDRVQFRYMLEGYDRGWSAPGKVREAPYTNLPPRPYRFRVMARNPDGTWNSAEAVVPFEIEAAFHQTLWFKLVLLAGCLGAIWAGYRIRMYQLTKRLSVRFEERLAERTRIAQELHDTLLQGFLSASMHLHLAADQLPEESPVKPQLNRVLKLIAQVIDEGRNALRGLRATTRDTAALDKAFLQVRQELGVEDEIEFRVIIDGRPRPLRPLLRDEVYRIGREALINAFRHAHARRIEVELKYSPRQFAMFVRDDGCGIDPEHLQSGGPGHWGLVGIRERSDRIGAQFHLLSRSSSGTELQLMIPGRVAFDAVGGQGLRWSPFRWRSSDGN